MLGIQEMGHLGRASYFWRVLGGGKPREGKNLREGNERRGLKGGDGGREQERGRERGGERGEHGEEAGSDGKVRR